jgi:hypothetical protein
MVKKKPSPKDQDPSSTTSKNHPSDHQSTTADSTGQALLDFLTIPAYQEPAAKEAMELDIHNTIVVPSRIPGTPPEVFHYPNVTEEQRQRALKRGYFPVWTLVLEMAKSLAWDEALPKLWDVLLCRMIPGQPQCLREVGERNRFAVLTKVFQAGLGDLSINYRHDKHPVIPPRLACYGVLQGDYARVAPPAGNGYWDCYIKIEEFKKWVDDLSMLIDVILPMPKVLLASDDIPESPYVFRKNGEKWQIIFSGHELKPIKNAYLRHIHYLITSFMDGKDDSISAIQLQLGTAMIHPSGTPGTSKGHRDLGGDGSWEPVADKKARDAYRDEESALANKLVLAKKSGRTAEAEALEKQLEELRDWKLREYGYKYDKKAHGSGELSGQLRNAAKDVSTGLGKCLRVLQKQNEDLFRHLDGALTPRGSLNAYKPQTPIDWVLE